MSFVGTPQEFLPPHLRTQASNPPHPVATQPPGAPAGYTTPHQAIHQAGVPQYQPPAGDERIQYVRNWIEKLKTENERAFNPFTIKAVLDGILQLLQYVTTGSVTGAQSGQVPGAPVSQQDPNAARVQFVHGGAQPAPGSPITNGDVQFVPGPPAMAEPTAGLQPNGQTVEYYGGPPGSQFSGGDTGGQRVEFYGGPQQNQGPAPVGAPPGPPPGYAPPHAYQQPPQQHDPNAGMPVSNQHQTVANPTGATFSAAPPAASVEAGTPVPPPGTPAAALAPPPVQSSVPPDRPAIPPPPINPQQVAASMPIPVAEVLPPNQALGQHVQQQPPQAEQPPTAPMPIGSGT